MPSIPALRPVVYLGALFMLGYGTRSVPATEPTREQAQFFEQKIRPLLAENCFKCHGPDKQKGGLRLDSLAAMLAGGESGPAIVPGKPEESLWSRPSTVRPGRCPPTASWPMETSPC